MKDEPELSLENLSEEMIKAIANPIIIDSSFENIQKMNQALLGPSLKIDNLEEELPNVKTQLNFKVPETLKKKDPYIINIKNDLNMYRKVYEDHAKEVNRIIEESKKQIKTLYNPLVELKNKILKYSQGFSNTINQLTFPLQEKKEFLISIDTQGYKEDKKKKFEKDKNEIIQEIENYLKKSGSYNESYSQINEKVLAETLKFVDLFEGLAKPVKDSTMFIKKAFKAFESVTDYFDDLNKKDKVDKAFQIIKEPLTKIGNLNEDIQKELQIIKKMSEEKGSAADINYDNTIKEMEKIRSELEKKSEDISNKIVKLRKNYGEKAMQQKIMKLNIPQNVQKDIINVTVHTMNIKKSIIGDVDQNTQKFQEDAKKALEQTRLDLLFIMDITSSMELYLNQVKKDIIAMMADIKAKCPGIEVDLGFIGYRDFNDLDLGDNYINLELTTDYESIKKNIEYVEADGGGDTPEDLCGAFEMAQNKNWKGKSRFAVIVTDSPCHGTKYHDLTGDQKDNYPEGDREKRDIEAYVKFFAEKEIHLYFLKITDITDKMFKIFNDVYQKNLPKDSKCKFIVESRKNNQFIGVVTNHVTEVFRNRKNLDVQEENKKGKKNVKEKVKESVKVNKKKK